MEPFKLFGLCAALLLLATACSKDDDFPDNVLFRNGSTSARTVSIYIYENDKQIELETVYIEAGNSRSIRLNPGNYYCRSRHFQAKEGYRAVFSFYTHEETFEYERM